VITIHQRYRQTDGRTDRRTTCDRNTALCTKVHRAVKSNLVHSVSDLARFLLFTSFTERLQNARVETTTTMEIWNCLSELLCTNCPNYT